MACVVIFSVTCLLEYSAFFSFIVGKRKKALEQSDSVPHFWVEAHAELPLEGENLLSQVRKSTGLMYYPSHKRTKRVKGVFLL